MAVETNIARGSFFVGARQTHRVDVVDSAGSPQNMTGWSLAYAWRREGKRVLAKTPTPGNGSGTNDRADVSIDASDTAGLAPGRYEWALCRSDSTNDVVLAWGTLELTRAAAQ